MILGPNTKANLSKQLIQLQKDTTGVTVAQTFGILTTVPEKGKEKMQVTGQNHKTIKVIK